jgi:hypothetical protein
MHSKGMNDSIVAGLSVVGAHGPSLSFLPPNILSEDFIESSFHGPMLLATAALFCRHLGILLGVRHEGSTQQLVILIKLGI